jgi:hypothetical protein
MRGLLVRVGIDSTCGEWNGPARRETGDFAYVPIPEGKPLRRGLARYYREFSDATRACGSEIPQSYCSSPTHLDPDFEYLTFGDQGQRGRRIQVLDSGDVLAFYAGLRAVEDGRLVYALIGLFVIDSVVRADQIAPERWKENAHTRRKEVFDDVVVRGRAGVSGRLRHCIPIGEYRNRAYRVTRELLNAWGGLDVADGYIHRSVRLPAFLNAPRFYRWFQAQTPELVAMNNPLV